MATSTVATKNITKEELMKRNLIQNLHPPTILPQPQK